MRVSAARSTSIEPMVAFAGGRGALRRILGRRSAATIAVAICVALAGSTLAVAAIRAVVPDVAPVYLLAVLAVGMRFGTAPAVVTSVAAFLLYDFLFVPPIYTFTIASPDEWLNLLLLLAVAVVIGRLAALQTQRAREAAGRALEAESLYRITGVLASTGTVEEAAPIVLARLAEATAMDRAWFGLGPTPTEERTVADTAPAEPLPLPGWQVVMQRPSDRPAHWVRTHIGRAGARRSPKVVVHRVRVEVAGEILGSLWALRARSDFEPDRAETRILAAAADQLGQAVVRDRLSGEATDAEILRESESLKSALLDSVSHDLRTPLATIRAAAGSMLDQSIQWTQEEQLEAFQTIDAEAERMGRLVRNLLDLSRIEGGALKPELAAQDASEVVRQAVARIHAQGKTIRVDVPHTLPPVLIDEVYLGQVLANLLENAVRYGGSTIVVQGRDLSDDGAVELTVADDGQGVPDRALGHLFDKFYQVPRTDGLSRRGMGIGLTVVAGLAHAMGGTVRAERGEAGGLAVAVLLRAADAPPANPDEGALAPVEAAR
jgi:two-component system, OmpR family, sensor histidine kinase KdpD